MSVAAGFIIVKVMQNAPEDTIFDLLSRLMGAWAGKCFVLLLGVYFLSFMYDSLDRAILITKDWLLPNTQPYMLMILLLVPTYIVAKHGPQILSPDEITLYNEPIVSILKSIEFRFIERIEVPFIAFYLFIFSLAWIPSAYITAF